jgi:hypothetical protein
MKAYVETIVRALVDHPEALRISSLEGKNSVILELRCHAQDIGRVIGRNGKTISAVRMLMAGLAARQRRKATLEVVE